MHYGCAVVQNSFTFLSSDVTGLFNLFSKINVFLIAAAIMLSNKQIAC